MILLKLDLPNKAGATDPTIIYQIHQFGGSFDLLLRDTKRVREDFLNPVFNLFVSPGAFFLWHHMASVGSLE